MKWNDYRSAYPYLSTKKEKKKKSKKEMERSSVAS